MLLFSATVFAQSTQDLAKGETDSTPQSTVWLTVGYYVLMFLAVCLFIGIIGKVLQVYDLTRRIQGKKEGINWNRIQGTGFALFLVLGVYGAYWSFANQGSRILPDAASEHGQRLDSMFWTTTIITGIVFFVTQILLFGFTYVYQASKKRKAYFYPHNNTIEKAWTIAPAIVLTVLVVLGFFTWRSITNVPKAEQESAINIDVTAHQFAWDVRYAGADNKLGVKNFRLIKGTNDLGVDFRDKNAYDDLRVSEMVIPVGKSVRLNLGSKDVLHSFYMPHFRVQMNCVPGLPTSFQFTPTKTTAQMQDELNDPKFEYLFYCAKICGASHYNMKFPVRVVSEGEYQKWVGEQKKYLTDQMKEEMKVADTKEAENNIVALNN
ncbi:MAG: cytochrome c oxidase subunit II [Mucilaginibacter polytrichastri]|nr:cytochrome c oxidase subunit II [Mucilaginibacter polytrichastri]